MHSHILHTTHANAANDKEFKAWKYRMVLIDCEAKKNNNKKKTKQIATNENKRNTGTTNNVADWFA